MPYWSKSMAQIAVMALCIASSGIQAIDTPDVNVYFDRTLGDWSELAMGAPSKKSVPLSRGIFCIPKEGVSTSKSKQASNLPIEGAVFL